MNAIQQLERMLGDATAIPRCPRCNSAQVERRKLGTMKCLVCAFRWGPT